MPQVGNNKFLFQYSHFLFLFTGRRIYLSIACGAAAGVLGLTNLAGFCGYFVSQLIVRHSLKVAATDGVGEGASLTYLFHPFFFFFFFFFDWQTGSILPLHPGQIPSGKIFPNVEALSRGFHAGNDDVYPLVDVRKQIPKPLFRNVKDLSFDTDGLLVLLVAL